MEAIICFHFNNLRLVYYWCFCLQARRALSFAVDQKKAKILSKNNLCVFSMELIGPTNGFLTSPHKVLPQDRLREKALRK